MKRGSLPLSALLLIRLVTPAGQTPAVPTDALNSPKVFETRWRQFRISHRVLNVLVAEIGLQRSGPMPPVGKRVAACMAQHVRMHAELEPGLDAQSRDHFGEARAGEGRAPLRHKHEGRVR